MRQILAPLITYVAMVACQRDAPQLAPNVARLVGTWQLRQSTIATPVTLQLSLDTANPPQDITPFLLKGQAPVNTYSGRLSAGLDGTMVCTRLEATEITGTTAANQTEQTYLANLKSAVRFAVTDENRLSLFYGNPQPGALEFDRVK